MDKMEVEKYKRELRKLEEQLSDDMIENLTREEIQEYIVLVSKIKARLELLENL